LKVREVEDLTATQETFQQRLDDLERGRDSFRTQYLEYREINKQLTMKVKALEKSQNAKLGGFNRTV